MYVTTIDNNNNNQTDILCSTEPVQVVTVHDNATPCRLWSLYSYTRCKHCNVHVQHKYGLCGHVINL